MNGQNTNSKNSTSASILELADGAIIERANYELGRIVENIRDLNTDPKKKRTLTIKIEFAPDYEREKIALNYTITPKLEATNPIQTQISLVSHSDGIMAVEAVARIPGQFDFDGGEQTAAKIIMIEQRGA